MKKVEAIGGVICSIVSDGLEGHVLTATDKAIDLSLRGYSYYFGNFVLLHPLVYHTLKVAEIVEKRESI